MEERPKRFSSVPPPNLGRERIGRYDIIYPLAQGGMASVYVGRLRAMAGFEKLVAIKVIHPHLSGQPEFVNMFLDEARLAACIHHPNVGEIFEVAEDDGLIFMVGELVQGHSLRSFMKRALSLGLNVSQPIAAFIGAKVCKGLQAAHELRGPEGETMHLVHRDVSPRNVLISYDGFVKLIDFGVAWAKDRVSHTEVGLLKGKIGYMSPEQLRGRVLDARSDLFSLGVVMYLMVTGTHPFPGTSDAERMHKILHGKFTPPRNINPNLIPAMERIILRAMASNPQDRFESASHMNQELKKFIRQTGETLGAAELSVLMHSLFALEKEEHDNRIRTFHRQVEERDRSLQIELQSHSCEPGPAVSMETNEDPSPELPGTAEEGGTYTEFSVTAASGEYDPRRQTHLAMVVGAILLAGALGVTALVLFSRPGPAPEPAAQDTAAALPLPRLSAALDASPLDSSSSGKDQDTVESPTARPRFVSVGLTLAPASARVSVDGEAVDVREGRIVLSSNGETHSLEISASGYETQTRELVADQDQQLEIRLSKVPRTGGSKRPSTQDGKAKTKSELKLRGSPY